MYTHIKRERKMKRRRQKYKLPLFSPDSQRQRLEMGLNISHCQHIQVTLTCSYLRTTWF